MSAENWMRRASGLVVPAMGFANPMGRFQACPPGECCPVVCGDCYPGASPASIWIDVPAIANNACSNCGNYEGTYKLDHLGGSPCWWGMVPANECSCVPLSGIVADIRAYVTVIGGQCVWIAFVRTCWRTAQNVQWRQTGAIGTWDITLPCYVNVGTDCDATGTEARLYV